jgi:5-methylcytosine-specific restriction endonuclease McrA
MRGHRRHLLRSVLAAAVAAGAWQYLREPGGLPGLGWAELTAVVLFPLALLCVTFWTGPAWWAALVPARTRAAYRHGRPRPGIPARLRRITFFADGRRCLYCHVTGPLCWDHGKPHDRGGLVSLWNGFTLCATHNIIKSDVWVYRGGQAGRGRAYYNPVTSHGYTEAHIAQALAILRAEQRRRWHPVRIARLLLGILVA